MGNGYPPRGNASRFTSAEPGRYVYSAPLRRQLASRGSGVCHVDISDKGGDEMDLEGIAMDATGYMSDGDVLGKNIRADDITSGYMTDGGLGLYTRRLNRLPDGMAAVRETLQRNTSLGLGDADSDACIPKEMQVVENLALFSKLAVPILLRHPRDISREQDGKSKQKN
ncbi:hypothetical protein BTVI_68995 [Pitangus sulphuratus]|nr:hypothetical protein BTVI_68995 [Pitangus sulphuratus]